MDGTITEELVCVLGDITKDHSMVYQGEKIYCDLAWFSPVRDSDTYIECPIPTNHPEYNKHLESKLSELEIGQKKQLRFKSVNPKNTAWICESLRDVE